MEGAEDLAGNDNSELRVFLNYRRDDTGGHALHLYTDLVERFGEASVFMDMRALEPGLDFDEAIEAALADCDVVLCLIGTRWLSAVTEQGTRRLDDPDDWVRLELEASLARARLRVIPLLVEKARMPAREELPEAVAPLARRQAFDLSNVHWHEDVAKLVRLLERVAALKAERLTQEKAERERFAQKEAERKRFERERADGERTARAQAEAERLAREQAERERVAAARAERDRRDRKRAEEERADRAQVEQERLAREKAQRVRLAAEQLEWERIERERTERERAARAQDEGKHHVAEEARERAASTILVDQELTAEAAPSHDELKTRSWGTAIAHARSRSRRTKVIVAALVATGLAALAAFMAISGLSARGQPPVFQTAWADSDLSFVPVPIEGRTALTLAFSETLDPKSVPPSESFVIRKGGSHYGIRSIDVWESNVIIGLGIGLPVGDTFTVSYRTPDANAIQDPDGNRAASFAEQVGVVTGD